MCIVQENGCKKRNNRCPYDIRPLPMSYCKSKKLCSKLLDKIFVGDN